MQKKLVILRVYVCLSIFFSILTMMFEPTSVYNRAVNLTDAPLLMIAGALFLCVISVFDIVINDFSPDKYRFGLAFDYRHLIYMSMAVLSFSVSVGVITAFGTNIAICRLWLDGSIAAIVAFLDILGRRGYSGSSIYIQPH